MTSLNLILIFLSVSLSVAAQLLLKKGMSSQIVQSALADSVHIQSIITILTNFWVLTGLFAYVSSAAIWLVVLSKIEVSKAYPFVGLGFIGTMLFAYWFLNEPLTLTKALGTLLVVCGVLLISK
ncbi:MAG: EamA family transporter [Paraglaciecola sp.]|nr:EamA family transporter [Paraglaciecola sp.]